MKCESFKQFAIVRSDSAQLFEEQLNARLRELNDKSPDVSFSEQGDYLLARIKYTEKILLENVKPDPTEVGIRFKCEDCPKFEPLRNKDGSENARAKIGDCELAEYGRTRRDMPACAVLYQMIENGGIKLCLSE